MKSIRQDFIHFASRAFFACAWADQCEESENESILSGQEIMQIMPDEIDTAAIDAAETLCRVMERSNAGSIDDLFSKAQELADGDRESTIENFGHYCAMQAMGHGVGLYDAFGNVVYETIKVPYIEFGSYSLSKDYF